MVDGIGVVGIISETSGEAQTLGDEAEVLLKGYVALKVVVPFSVVTGLCCRYPWVDLCKRQRSYSYSTDILVADDFTYTRCISVRKEHWRIECIVTEELSPYIVVTDTWRVTLVQVTGNTELQDCCPCDVDIDIQTIVPTTIVGVGVVLLSQSLVGLVHTLVLCVRNRSEVARCRTTTTDVEVSAIAHCAVLKQELLPIDVWIEVGVEAALDERKLCRLIESTEVTGDTCLVDEVGVFHTAYKLWSDGTGVVRCLELTVDVDLTFLTVLGLDEDNAVSTFRSVDSCCRSILQDCELLDILDVDIVDVVTLESIDHYQG